MVVQFETYGVDGATANSASVDNWATLDRWGHIWIWEFEPQLDSGGDFWVAINPETKHHRIGNAHLLGVDLMPRRIRKP